MPILRPLASAGKRACWLLMGLCLGLPALAAGTIACCMMGATVGLLSPG